MKIYVDIWWQCRLKNFKMIFTFASRSCFLDFPVIGVHKTEEEKREKGLMMLNLMKYVIKGKVQ